MQTDIGTTAYQRYVSGDDSAMADLLQSYWDGLLWYLNSITGNLHTAEEAAEEAFVKLAIQKPKFRGGSSFRTWLYAIGRNAARDMLRKNNREAIRHTYDHAQDTATAESEFSARSRNCSYTAQWKTYLLITVRYYICAILRSLIRRKSAK